MLLSFECKNRDDYSEISKSLRRQVRLQYKVQFLLLFLSQNIFQTMISNDHQKLEYIMYFQSSEVHSGV